MSSSFLLSHSFPLGVQRFIKPNRFHHIQLFHSNSIRPLSYFPNSLYGSIFPQHSSYPQKYVLAVRKLGDDGSAQHPNLSDHQELTDTAFHELRFYRYYRFSEKVAAHTQQRGFMAASLLFFYALIVYIIMQLMDDATQPRMWHRHRLKRLYLEKRGERSQWQWNKDMFGQWKKMCDESLPELRSKGHDALTYREYMDTCSLHECVKRDPEFHSTLLHMGFRLMECPGTNVKWDSDIDSD